METIEHFAQISLVARQLGRENLLSREEVDRLQGLRGRYGIASPAPICIDEPLVTGTPAGDASCQAVYAPSAPGDRLVPDTSVAQGAPTSLVGTDGEIRLTYAQLTALIDDAVKQVTEGLGLKR
jgi:L-fuculose-phosphate aldolase